MVPEGWKWRKLGEVAELQRGFDLPKASRIEGSVPIISSGGISGYHNEHKAEAPGVVTGRYGSIGDVFFVEENFWPLNTSLWVKNFHGNHAKFIYYLLSKFEFSKFSDKTGVPGVNRNDLHAVKVGVPPQPEQKKIAQILSTWDQAITTTERLLENSQQRKKGLMQQLLTGKKRLPGFEGEWEDGKLRDIAAISKGKALSSKDLEDGVFPVVAGGKTSPYTHKTYTHDHAITVSASGAYAGYVAYHEYKFWASDCSVVEASEESNIEFLFHLMTWNQQRIYALQSGGAQPHVYPKDLNSIRVLIPSKNEQQAIANTLTTASKETEQLQNRVNRLKQEKNALMQQLLTGKRRVNVDTEAE